jgi:hypothetical protein
MDNLNQTQENKSSFKYIWFFIVLMLAIGGVLYYSGFFKNLFTLQNNSQNANLTEENIVKSEIGDAHSLYASKQYQEAVKAYENILAKHTNIAQPMLFQVKKQLAASYFALAGDKRSAEDGKKAISLYKDIIADSKNSNEDKAQTINELVFLLNKAPAQGVYKKEAFGSGPLASIVDQQDGLRLSRRKASEYSYSLHPTALAAYQVAIWYLGQEDPALNNSAEAKASFKKSLEEWGAKGDLLVGKEASTSEYVNDGYLYQQAARISAGRGKNEAAEGFFNKALAYYDDKIKKDSVSSGYFDSSLYTRYFYALFLAEKYGSSRKEDIKNLLSPMLNLPNGFSAKQLSFFTFFKNESTSQYVKKEFKVFLDAVPALKSFL